MTIGAEASRSLGSGGSSGGSGSSNSLTPYLNPTTGGFGLSALNRARSGGLSDSQIIASLPGSGASAVGDLAAQALRSPSPAKTAPQQQEVDYQRVYSDALTAATAQFQQTQQNQTNAYRTEAELSTAKAERDAALAKAKTWEDQYNRDREYQISDQLRGLRSGSTVGGSGYSAGGGATTGGDGLSVRARGRNDASISEYQRYSSLLGGDNQSGGGSTNAAASVSSLASGTSSASRPSGPSRAALSGYYSKRFR